MITLFSVVVLGLFLGMRHATDADHVIAVTTIVSRENKLHSAALIGCLWGICHTITVVMVVGSAILLFGLAIPRRTGLALEFSVGIMLIILGLLNLKDLRNWFRSFGQQESTERDHDELVTAKVDRLFGNLKFYQILRPLVVGIVHGLAGSAALATDGVANHSRSAYWAVAYLMVFGIGTIVGMMLITAAIIAIPFSWTARRSFQIFNKRPFASCHQFSGCRWLWSIPRLPNRIRRRPV